MDKIYLIPTIAVAIAFFITLMIYAQYPATDVCYAPFPNDDKSECWRIVPYLFMGIIIIPAYVIFIMALWLWRKFGRKADSHRATPV